VGVRFRDVVANDVNPGAARPDRRSRRHLRRRAVALGLRAKFDVGTAANFGLIPLIHKGIVDVGYADWFVEAAFPDDRDARQRLHARGGGAHRLRLLMRKLQLQCVSAVSPRGIMLPRSSGRARQRASPTVMIRASAAARVRHTRLAEELPRGDAMSTTVSRLKSVRVVGHAQPLVPGLKLVVMALTALPVGVVGMAGDTSAERSAVDGGDWLALLPVALYRVGRRLRCGGGNCHHAARGDCAAVQLDSVHHRSLDVRLMLSWRCRVVSSPQKAQARFAALLRPLFAARLR
jgi:hypothetical protein